MDRKNFEDTLNELNQIRQELYELEEKIAEMKNQIHLMNVEESDILYFFMNYISRDLKG